MHMMKNNAMERSITFCINKMRALFGMLLAIENVARGTRGTGMVLKWMLRGSTYDIKT